MGVWNRLRRRNRQQESEAVVDITRQIFEYRFPHILRIWNEIRSKFADREFTYSDLFSLGIWQGEASDALTYLSQVCGRVEVVGKGVFKIRSIAPLDEQGVNLETKQDSKKLSLILKLHKQYVGRVQEVAKTVAEAFVSSYGSLFRKEKGKLIDVTSYTGGRGRKRGNAGIVFHLHTKPATSSEVEGFIGWAVLWTKDYGAMESTIHA